MPSTPRRRISFADDLAITVGGKRDWPAFATWHYRSHRLGVVRFVTLLWHERDWGMGIVDCGSKSSSIRDPKSGLHNSPPVGICVFTAPPLALAGRNRFFGTTGRWSRTRCRVLNDQLVMLSRVVLHPTYRGAGLAADFVRESCRMSGWPWVEALAQMGRVNPFFERAGFIRVDVPTRSRQRRTNDRRRHSSIYGGRRRGTKPMLSAETHRKSRYADPVYYVLDNRAAVERVGGSE